MKTFYNIKPTFLAMMVFGWLACNIAFWLPRLARANWHSGDDVGAIVVVGVATWLVILFAWLLIFLPVDTAIAETSQWRRPGPAALIGFLESFALVAVLFVSSCSDAIAKEGLLRVVKEAILGEDMSYGLAACVTGAVAGWTRGLMRKPVAGEA